VSFVQSCRPSFVHPEDNLDEDKALILFDMCKSAIVAMASELKSAGLSIAPVAAGQNPEYLGTFRFASLVNRENCNY
jgi:hypothetical protein